MQKKPPKVPNPKELITFTAGIVTIHLDPNRESDEVLRSRFEIRLAEAEFERKSPAKR